MKYLYIILLVLPLIGFGQGWEQTFGGEYFDSGGSVQITDDGGYIITGYTDVGIDDRDVYLIKTNQNGDEEWSQTFGGQGNDLGWSIQTTFDES